MHIRDKIQHRNKSTQYSQRITLSNIWIWQTGIKLQNWDDYLSFTSCLAEHRGQNPQLYQYWYLTAEKLRPPNLTLLSRIFHASAT